MSEANEVDGVVIRLNKASSGIDEWRVQDPVTGSYCIAFNHSESVNPEREAREWLAETKKNYPEGRFSGFEVGIGGAECVNMIPMHLVEQTNMTTHKPMLFE